MSHVGIAFAICFIVGPPIGAYFASRPFPLPIAYTGIELNIYATPAILTLLLLVAETVFLIVALPETRGKGPLGSQNSQNGEAKQTREAVHPTSAPEQIQKRLATLKNLKSVHFWFLGIFSGVEFTLTFLTFDREWRTSTCNYSYSLVMTLLFQSSIGPTPKMVASSALLAS